MKFAWDKTKAKNNLVKYGVSFEEATRAFDDLFAVEYRDDRQDYDEERFIILAMVDIEVLSVAYVERDELIRIISARRATKDEEKNYFEQNRYSASDDSPRH